MKADAAGLGAFATAGASIAFAWVDKIVEAYVAGPDAGRGLGAAIVSATGTAPAITANTGDFTIGFDDDEDTADPGGIESPFGVSSMPSLTSSTTRSPRRSRTS